MATLRIRHHILRRIYRALFRRLLGNAGYGQEMMLWFHLERHLDRGFARQIDEIVTWADVVLLEYPFWAGVVAPLCEIRGRKLILTNHDVLHAQVTASRPLRWITRRMEMRGLATADQVVSVSPNDQRTFAKAGIASIVIPNPVDTGKLGGDMPGDLRRFLSALCHIDLPPGPVCFFVGSNFGPNVGAAMRLRGIAAAMAGDATPPLFVIAGACAPPERSGNFIALGRVDDFALTLLYHLAQIIAIPLSEGTGSSIKTVEALAARRPVLGTNIAFRGLTISPGVDCIVEDSFQEWPTHIRALLADPERAAALAAMARETAAAYDYRLIYAAYLPLIGLPPEEAARSVKPGLGLPDNLVVLCQARGILGSVMPLLTSPDQRCTPGNDALLRDVMIAGAIDNNDDVVMEARMALAALDAPVVGPLTGHYGPASIAVLRLLDESHAL